MKGKLVLVSVFAVSLVAAGCGPDLRKEYRDWVARQSYPNLNLEVSQTNEQVTVRAQAGGSKISLRVDELPVEEGNNLVEQTLGLLDGKHSVSAVADQCYEVPPRYKEVAPEWLCLQSRDAREFIVDTTKPELEYAQAWVDEKETDILNVAGHAQDKDGFSRVLVNNQETTLETAGFFHARLPYAGQLIVTVQVKDRIGNSQVFQIPVTLPSNRWEKRDSRDGSLLALVTAPNFEPSENPITGVGFGVQWLRYEDGKPVRVLETPDEWWWLVIGASTLTFLGLVLFLTRRWWFSYLQLSAAAGTWAVRFKQLGDRLMAVFEQRVDLVEGKTNQEVVAAVLSSAPVQEVFADFAREHPEAAQELQDYLSREGGNQ